MQGLVGSRYSPRPRPPRTSPERELLEQWLPPPRAEGAGLTPAGFGLLSQTDVAPPLHKLAADTDLD